jgi:uncharacterized membrane protein (Fun14 family)
MEKEEKKSFNSIKRATVLSGIGMGLLLGLIMGLSTSEVVKVVMAALTALLGVFFGFEKRSFSGMQKEEYEKDKNETLLTALRAGWFGLSVVAGILFGMWIRTNEVFTIPVEKSVQQWIDAGVDSAYARKLVIYERLAIDPNTGEAGEIGTMQRGHQSSLFSAESIKKISNAIDTLNWDNNWEFAKQELLNLQNAALSDLVSTVEINIPENERFAFLGSLRILVINLTEKTTFCKFGTDLKKWEENEITYSVAAQVQKLPAVNQNEIMLSLSKLVCDLEKK